MDRQEFYSDMLGIPVEILDFIFGVFLLVEVRGRVGKVDGLIFTIRTKEANHQKPHIHAEYAQHCVSIAIENSEILAGNIPKKQMRVAQNWVANHRDLLLGKWRDIAINRELPMIASALDRIGEK